MRFNPPQASATQSSSFAVSMMIDAATDVVAAPFQVSFDPKMLRLNDVTVGEFMSSDGQQPAFSKNIQNDAGQATIQLNRLPGTPGANGCSARPPSRTPSP